MTLSLVFNELSLQENNLAPDARTACQRMTGLVSTLKTAIDYNLNKVRTHEHFVDMVLAKAYPLRKWLNDPNVATEEQDFLLFYITQYPPIVPPTADLSEGDTLLERSELFEAHYDGNRANGLGYAVLFDGISLSLLSESCWDTPTIDLLCTEYSPEVGGFVDGPETIRHASRAEHISHAHVEWIRDRVRNAVRDGNDLWFKVDEWFPNLIFCENVRRQIQALLSGTPQLSGIVERLLALETYCKNWDGDGFDRRVLPPQYGCSPESSQTLNRFGNQREFECPDGKRRLFDLHLKGLRGHWRIHIWPDAANRKIIVGYIGPHLPTDSDPT